MPTIHHCYCCIYLYLVFAWLNNTRNNTLRILLIRTIWVTSFADEIWLYTFTQHFLSIFRTRLVFMNMRMLFTNTPEGCGQTIRRDAPVIIRFETWNRDHVIRFESLCSCHWCDDFSYNQQSFLSHIGFSDCDWVLHKFRMKLVAKHKIN